jgi:hypothetical protein
MNGRRLIPLALLVLAGVLSLSATLFGGLSLVSSGHSVGADLRLAFSIPLILLFPFFLLSFFWPRLAAALQFINAFTFMAATLAVNMHNCGRSHPCPDFFHLVVGSFLEGTTMVPFVIAVLQTLSTYMRSPHPAARPVRWPT